MSPTGGRDIWVSVGLWGMPVLVLSDTNTSTLLCQTNGQVTFLGWGGGGGHLRGLWAVSGHGRDPQLSPASLTGLTAVGAPDGLRGLLCVCPSSCHMMCVMVCAHVICTHWPLSNWNSSSCSQDKNNLRPFSPEKFELPVSGSELADRARGSLPVLQGWRCPQDPVPGPCLPPGPGFPLFATQGRHRQRPDGARSCHRLGWSWVPTLGRVSSRELGCLGRGKLFPVRATTL